MNKVRSSGKSIRSCVYLISRFKLCLTVNFFDKAPVKFERLLAGELVEGIAPLPLPLPDVTSSWLRRCCPALGSISSFLPFSHCTSSSPYYLNHLHFFMSGCHFLKLNEITSQILTFSGVSRWWLYRALPTSKWNKFENFFSLSV